jgi:hypothetical protein
LEKKVFSFIIIVNNKEARENVFLLAGDMKTATGTESG